MLVFLTLDFSLVEKRPSAVNDALSLLCLQVALRMLLITLLRTRRLEVSHMMFMMLALTTRCVHVHCLHLIFMMLTLAATEHLLSDASSRCLPLGQESLLLTSAARVCSLLPFPPDTHDASSSHLLMLLKLVPAAPLAGSFPSDARDARSHCSALMFALAVRLLKFVLMLMRLAHSARLFTISLLMHTTVAFNA